MSAHKHSLSVDSHIRDLYDYFGREISTTDFFAHLCRDFGACNVSLCVLDSVTATSLYECSPRIPADLIKRYTERMHEDPWFAASPSGPSVVWGSQLVEPRKYRRSAIYNDFCRHQDIEYVVACACLKAGELASFLAVNRPAGPDFSAVHREALAEILPHFLRAVKFSLMPTSAYWLEGVGVPALQISARGIEWMNPAAADCLRPRRGLYIRHNRLRVANAVLDHSLQTMLNRITSGDWRGPGKPRFELLLPDPERPRRLLMIPSLQVSREVNRSHWAVVLILEPGSDAIEVQAHSYGLTPAEVRLVDGLLSGESLASYASRTSHAISTVRTQLKSIFRRTNTSSQLGLLRKLVLGK